MKMIRVFERECGIKVHSSEISKSINYINIGILVNNHIKMGLIERFPFRQEHSIPYHMVAIPLRLFARLPVKRIKAHIQHSSV